MTPPLPRGVSDTSLGESQKGAEGASAHDASIGSAIRLGAEIVVRLSSVIATLWLTRSLGVSTFGVFLLSLSLGLMIAELCDLGLNAIVVPLIVRCRGNLRALLRLKALATLAVLALCAVLIPFASHVSGIESRLLALTTIHFIGASWIEMTGTTLRALGRRMHEALLLFAFRLAVVGLVIGAPFGPTVGGASLSYAVATLPAIVASGFLLRSAVRCAGSSSATARAIVRQAAPLGVNGYLSLLSTRVELFLLQAFSGAEAVGLFGGALRIVESLLTLPSAIAAGALPSVSRDVVQGSRGAAQRTFGLVVWMGVPAALGLGLCAHDVLRVLGPAFVDGAAALRILSAALFLCFANAVLFHILIAAGQTTIVPRLTASRVAVACLAGSLLVPAFGLVGAALSFCAAELFLFSALVARTRAHASIHVGRPVAWALTACLPMTALLWLDPLPLPLAIAAGGSSFAVAAAVILRRGTEASGLA